MYIEEFKAGDELRCAEEVKLAASEVVGGGIAALDAKRVLVGAGARVLFYPTLLYNVVRNKVQAEFRWWDWVDEFVLLGAVPFRSDVRLLKELGVRGVITLNEPYETLVPTSLYRAHNINHLVLPTRDYLFAPSMDDISEAVKFIHENALRGHSTYVHCKAGRGRSTTIVICYLMQYKQMMPDAAYSYVKSIRPRVLLAPAQLQAVQDFFYLKLKSMGISRHVYMCSSLSHVTGVVMKSNKVASARDVFAFDEDGSVVVVTGADLDGYEPAAAGIGNNEMWRDLNLVYRVQVVGQAALAKFSCLWFQRISSEKLSHRKSSSSFSMTTPDKMGGGITSVDIQVY